MLKVQCPYLVQLHQCKRARRKSKQGLKQIRNTGGDIRSAACCPPFYFIHASTVKKELFKALNFARRDISLLVHLCFSFNSLFQLGICSMVNLTFSRRNSPFPGHIHSYEHTQTHTLISKECSPHSSCLYTSCSDSHIFQLMQSHAAAQFLSCSLDADLFSKSTCKVDQMKTVEEGLFSRPIPCPTQKRKKKEPHNNIFSLYLALEIYSLISSPNSFATAGSLFRQFYLPADLQHPVLTEN